MIFHAPSRKMRKWLEAKSQAVRVGKCCTILIKEICHKCDYAEVAKIAFKTIKQPNTDCQCCRNCIALMYKTAYGEDLNLEGTPCTK